MLYSIYIQLNYLRLYFGWPVNKKYEFRVNYASCFCAFCLLTFSFLNCISLFTLFFSYSLSCSTPCWVGSSPDTVRDSNENMRTFTQETWENYRREGRIILNNSEDGGERTSEPDYIWPRTNDYVYKQHFISHRRDSCRYQTWQPCNKYCVLLSVKFKFFNYLLNSH